MFDPKQRTNHTCRSWQENTSYSIQLVFKSLTFKIFSVSAWKKKQR